jgi:brachyury protein
MKTLIQQSNQTYFYVCVCYRCRYVEGRWIPSGKAERPPSNAIYVHNESPNFGAHWMKEPVNFSKLKLSNKKSEPGMVRHF